MDIIAMASIWHKHLMLLLILGPQILLTQLLGEHVEVPNTVSGLAMHCQLVMRTGSRSQLLFLQILVV